MYPKYFRDKISNELEATCTYLKKALDAVKCHPEWSEKFKQMSDDRYKLALSLYGMFMELYKESKEQDTYINSVRDGIIDNITAQSQKIESYKMSYNLMLGKVGDNI